MTGAAGRQRFEARLPQDVMDRLCQPCGVIARRRTRPRGMVGRAMVMSAGTPGGAYQADVGRAYLECAGPRVTGAACERWFDQPREPCLAARAERARASARWPEGERPGPLRGVQDGDSVVSTTVTVRDARREALPGTGDDAASTGQHGLAVGCGAPVRDHVRPAREQDSRPLQRADAWRGEGWLAARAAARLARRRACDADAVRGVSRRPAHWQPTGDDSARGPLSPEGLPGTDREARLEAEPLVRDGRTLDADVPLGGTPPPLHRRRVGVPPPTGDGFGRTPRPPRLGPRQVAARDRVRWEGDRRLRLDPSGPRLDAVATAPPGALKTRLEAALLASPRAALLAHTQHLQTRPSPTGSPRTAAPRHPRRLALPWAVSCQASAEACPRHAVVAKRRWEKIAAWLTPAGKDPHGRRRPSVLAQFRGWKRQPVVRKHTNPRHVQAAASVDTYGVGGLPPRTFSEASLDVKRSQLGLS